MRILIASDLHGSSYYTGRLCEIFDEMQGDLLILLGDIYNHGPRNPLPKEYNPMKVASLLNERKEKLMVIKGNCDSEVDTLISEFDFVDFGEVFADGLRIGLTHGHKFNKDNLPCGDYDVLLYGHFHTGFIIQAGGMTIANPGSVSIPKDGKHSFIVFENGQMTLAEIAELKSVDE